MTSTETPAVRRVLVIAHTGRQEARDVADAFCRALHRHGIVLRLLEDEAHELALDLPGLEVVKPTAEAGADCELAVVIGGTARSCVPPSSPGRVALLSSE